VSEVSGTSKPPAQLQELLNTAAVKVGVLEELVDNKPQVKKLMALQSADEQGGGSTEARTHERVQQPTTPLLEQQPAIQSGKAASTHTKSRQESVAKPDNESGTEAESKSNASQGLDDIRCAAQEVAVATAAAPTGPSVSSSTPEVLASADSTASTAGTAPSKASGSGVFALLLSLPSCLVLSVMAQKVKRKASWSSSLLVFRV
jgi:hypothetical protein